MEQNAALSQKGQGNPSIVRFKVKGKRMCTKYGNLSKWDLRVGPAGQWKPWLSFCVAYMHFKERIYHCMFPSVTPLIIAA